MAAKWEGGDLWVFAPQWSSGRSNSGNGSSKNPALTKRGRFNPNPTRANHPGCLIAKQAKEDKEKAKTDRRTFVFESRAKGNT